MSKKNRRSENINHRYVITSQLRTQIVTAEVFLMFCSDVLYLCVDRSSRNSDVLLGLPGRGGPQIGHSVLGEDGRAQMMKLTQVKLAHIVSSAVSQALTKKMQQIGNSPPPATAANHARQNTTTVQQVQSPIKFDVPALKRIVQQAGCLETYQARACGFEAELTSAEREELSVRADVLDRSNVDSVRLRNAHVAWMTLINSCRE